MLTRLTEEAEKRKSGEPGVGGTFPKRKPNKGAQSVMSLEDFEKHMAKTNEGGAGAIVKISETDEGEGEVDGKNGVSRTAVAQAGEGSCCSTDKIVSMHEAFTELAQERLKNLRKVHDIAGKLRHKSIIFRHFWVAIFDLIRLIVPSLVSYGHLVTSSALSNTSVISETSLWPETSCRQCRPTC
jgi:hypothetical protein